MPNKSVRYSSSSSSFACVCVCVKKKNRWWLILFSLGTTRGEKKKTVLIALGRVYRPTLYRPSSLKASTLSYYYTTPPPTHHFSWVFFFTMIFFTWGFFFSPLCIFISPPLYSHTHNSRWCAVWSRVLGREEMKENYTGLSASHYTSTFFFFFYPFVSLFLFLFSPFFFYLERRKKNTKKIIDNCRADIYNGRHTQHLEGGYI